MASYCIEKSIDVFPKLYDKNDPQPEFLVLYTLDRVALKTYSIKNIVQGSITFGSRQRMKNGE
jgi:hypothetical protein